MGFSWFRKVWPGPSCSSGWPAQVIKDLLFPSHASGFLKAPEDLCKILQIYTGSFSFPNPTGFKGSSKCLFLLQFHLVFPHSFGFLQILRGSFRFHLVPKGHSRFFFSKVLRVQLHSRRFFCIIVDSLEFREVPLFCQSRQSPGFDIHDIMEALTHPQPTCLQPPAPSSPCLT